MELVKFFNLKPPCWRLSGDGSAAAWIVEYRWRTAKIK